MRAPLHLAAEDERLANDDDNGNATDDSLIILAGALQALDEADSIALEELFVAVSEAEKHPARAPQLQACLRKCAGLIGAREPEAAQYLLEMARIIAASLAHGSIGLQ